MKYSKKRTTCPAFPSLKMPKAKKPKIKIREIKSKIKIIEEKKGENLEEQLEKDSSSEESPEEFGELSEHTRSMFSPKDALSRSQMPPVFQAIPQESPQDVSQEVSPESATERNRSRETAVGYATARSQQESMTELEKEEARIRRYESPASRQVIAPQLNPNMLRRSPAQQTSEAEEEASLGNRQRIQTQEPSMLRSEEGEAKKYDFDSSQSEMQKRRRRMF